jgi:hypothetical protein
MILKFTQIGCYGESLRETGQAVRRIFAGKPPTRRRLRVEKRLEARDFGSQLA